MLKYLKQKIILFLIEIFHFLENFICQIFIKSINNNLKDVQYNMFNIKYKT